MVAALLPTLIPILVTAASPAQGAGAIRRVVDRNHPLLLTQLVMGYNIGFD